MESDQNYNMLTNEQLYPNIMQSQNSGSIARPVGPEPVYMHCPSCQTEIRTKIQTKSTSKTHLNALLCCLFCWCICCCCLPYCMSSCKNKNHYCPNCNSFLGTYSA